MRNYAYRDDTAPSPIISLALQQALRSRGGFADRPPAAVHTDAAGGRILLPVNGP